MFGDSDESYDSDLDPVDIEEVSDTKTEEPTQEEERAFRESGKCDDEITFEFDDNKKLYVSKNFLRYASPVFEAMFSHDFKEKTQNSVKLPGKKYENFLEFLLCMHPGILKSIKESNVLMIVEITEEYQVASVTTRCKEVLKDWLLKSVAEAKTKSFYRHRAKPLRDCLTVLTTVTKLNYDTLVTLGVRTIAKFGHIHYIQDETDRAARSNLPCNPKPVGSVDQIEADCMDMFSCLPAEVKCRILSERLMLWKDTNMK